MTPDTKITEAGFSVRAVRAVLMLLARRSGTVGNNWTAYKAVCERVHERATLRDVASFTSRDFLDLNNCGEGTVRSIKAVLHNAGLKLADEDTGPAALASPIIESKFIALAETDAIGVVRLLCEHLPRQALVAAAIKAGIK